MITTLILSLCLEWTAQAAKPNLAADTKPPAPNFDVLNKELFLVWSLNDQYAAPEMIKPGPGSMRSAEMPPAEFLNFIEQHPVRRTKILQADKVNALVEYEFDIGPVRNFFKLNKQSFWLPLSGLAIESCKGEYCPGDLVEFSTAEGKKTKNRVLGFNVFGDMLCDGRAVPQWINTQANSGMRRVQ